MERMQQEVRGMVREQLRSAGFDPDLTAANLTTVQQSTYASVVAPSFSAMQSVTDKPTTRNPTADERREDKFWEARRSLRIWPVERAERDGLEEFLLNKLRMDRQAVNDLDITSIRKCVEPRNKNKHEVCVIFGCKEMRDSVKSQAHHLANHREEAGMRLQIPNHLQKDFRVLMKLSYNLKKKHPDLRRNVKFDEQDLGLFMDLQTEREGPWKLVKPEQARKAVPESTGPSDDEEEVHGPTLDKPED